MKMKELKNLAQKIAKQEMIIASNASQEEKSKAEAEIMKLSSKVKGFDDIMIIDELVQEILQKT